MTTEIITCKRCGHENPASANACMKCNGSLREPTAEEQALAEISQEVQRAQEASELGQWVAAVGLLVVFGSAGWVAWTMADLGEYRDLSAVQVTQLYTQGGLWVLVGIGILLAGILWVVSTRE